jgi:uncharacterized repeat protein (TIGR03803 family)
LLGCGTVFKITPQGGLTTLYSFCSQTSCADGDNPFSGLVQGTDGNLYGLTSSGGDPSCRPGEGCGTVFKITRGGTLTTLYSFHAVGLNPQYAPLVQGIDGNFYGTTVSGGHGAACTSLIGCGTAFKITPRGTLTTLYNFCSQTNCVDGESPFAPLVQATDGNLYGTTNEGGASNSCRYGCGTVFKITPQGMLTTLHSFDLTDGESPNGGLVQDTNGPFYGTTNGGGTNYDGTVFSLAVGLGPFVESVPTSGKVGAAVTILGSKLTGATSVTFNGTRATFTVVSSTEITTMVPTGATTGKVQVTKPVGTVTSNVAFHVLP